MPLSCDAPAKVNLALHVTGRREDGYHLLDTVAVFTGIGDTLEARRADELSLEIAGPFAADLGGEASGNLIWRAARAMMAAFDAPPLAFRLTKNLPVASGIGGGSADAAAALRLLADASPAFPEPAALDAIALSLGADVPMCLSSTPLRATGIGEAVAPLPAFPSLSLVLVNPGVAVPTGDVFRRLAGRHGPPLADPSGLRDIRDVTEWLGSVGNDLEAPARAIAPEIGEALSALAASPACVAARMSGSGATCFGVYADMEAARDAAAGAIAADHPGWWIEATHTRCAGAGPRS